jgi:hypothetical protein
VAFQDGPLLASCVPGHEQPVSFREVGVAGRPSWVKVIREVHAEGREPGLRGVLIGLASRYAKENRGIDVERFNIEWCLVSISVIVAEPLT